MRYVIGLYMVTLLQGCALTQKIHHLQQHFENQEQVTERAQQSFEEKIRIRQSVNYVEQPWIIGKAQPLAKELVLPQALQQGVMTTLLFQDQGLLLDQIAERITMATSIPVRIQPEALLPREAFLNTSVRNIQAMNQRRLHLTGPAEPLAQTLDRVSAFFDVYWRFDDQIIEFYKITTRSFQVRTLSLESTSHASVGSQQLNQQQGFKSQSGTELIKAQSNELENLKERLTLFLTPLGRIATAAGGAGTIVVSDTPAVLDQIHLMIKQENQALTRRVRLVFEEITISAKEQAELNIDWNVVFNSAQLLASAQIGGLGTTALQQLGTAVQSGPFTQTDVFVKAISDVANVVRRHSMPVLSLNRRPVTQALRTTFSYVDKVESSPYSTGIGLVNNTLSLSQKEETVGSVLTLLPDIQDDGQVLLSVAYDNTVAQPLKTITIGSSDQGLQVQQITIEGSGTVQQVLLRPGQPIVISGFDRSEQEHAERRLNPQVPLFFGGGNKVQKQYLRTLIVITAQVEEDAE